MRPRQPSWAVTTSSPGYLNLRGYKDLETENRPKSWTGWVTFSLSPAAPEPAVTKPVARKY
ncbi:hypothetical protein GGD63_000564 [Bradyrhizobium sp. cir1]|uniref:hypothetical protein n=1 Tax=Bradyrhizobium sp. cir1 TaxID=1445730 RepID=UPI0018293138|nr:hypothetical protein [Bradyrhizobium sp. cir1]MBB4367795.1 hypothetical protein [Bradyrhizobium sp. cir1]